MDHKRATATVLQQTPPQSAPGPRVVLKELIDLLEDYAPSWYTEEIHDRALAALSSKKLN